MAYKRIINMEVLDIIRRYFDSQSISQISSVSGIDRKTVRKYIKEIHNRGITFYDKEKIIPILPEIIPRISGRPTEAQSKQEILNLITSADNKIKPKTAFEVIKDRHALEAKVSYSSFKRFIRENKFVFHNDKTTCRLDYQAGEQIQIDYAKMGMLYDPILKRNRAVYGFIGTLSYSRYKFVEFVFSQDQQSAYRRICTVSCKDV